MWQHFPNILLLRSRERIQSAKIWLLFFALPATTKKSESNRHALRDFYNRHEIRDFYTTDRQALLLVLLPRKGIVVYWDYLRATPILKCPYSYL